MNLIKSSFAVNGSELQEIVRTLLNQGGNETVVSREIEMSGDFRPGIQRDMTFLFTPTVSQATQTDEAT